MFKGRVFPTGTCVELKFCQGAVFGIFEDGDFGIFLLYPGSTSWEYCESASDLNEAIEFLADHFSEWSRFQAQENLERCLEIS